MKKFPGSNYNIKSEGSKEKMPEVHEGEEKSLKEDNKNNKNIDLENQKKIDEAFLKKPDINMINNEIEQKQENPTKLISKVKVIKKKEVIDNDINKTQKHKESPPIEIIKKLPSNDLCELAREHWNDNISEKNPLWYPIFKEFTNETSITINSNLSLGGGKSSRVFLGKSNNRSYAVKFIIVKDSPKLLDLAKKESSFHLNIKNKYFLKCNNCFEFQNYIAIVYQHCETWTSVELSVI